ncbi:MAG: Wzz/FepE/Etk N-terminal domain-containing protein [Sulfobacillus sp.]
MNFTQYLLVLGARKWIILGTLLLTVLTTTVVTYLLPKQYTATASLVVNMKTKDPVTGQILPIQLLPGYLTTQVDIIKSQRVALRVVHDLKLASNPVTQSVFMTETKGRGDIHDWLAGLLLKRVVAKPLPRSSIVNVSFSAHTPWLAALAANAFVRAYIATNLELQKAPEDQTVAWLNQQIDRIGDHLKKAQLALAAYQRTHGIVGTGRGGTVQNLRVLLIQSEAKLAQLGQTLGKNNPRYQRALAEVGVLRERLNKAANIESATPGAKGAQSGENGTLLQRNVDNYQRMYSAAMERYGAATMEAAYNQTDIAPLTKATVPLNPSWPKPVLNISISTVLGLMLGIAFALLAEMIDRRVRSGQDIVTEVMVPVLAELSPKPPRFARLRRWFGGLQRAPA